MICLPTVGLAGLLAQREAWESLGNHFSGEHAQLNLNDLWALGGVILAGAALVGLLRWLYGWQQARRLSCEPRHLFIDLCCAHRLRRCERKRLRELADHHDLLQPAVLFVRPDLYHVASLPDDDELTAECYRRLKNKLFAGLTEDDVEPLADIAPETVSGPVVVPTVTIAVDAPTPEGVS